MLDTASARPFGITFFARPESDGSPAVRRLGPLRPASS